MRQTVLTAVVATLLIGTIVEVVAAGGKSVMARHHFYYAAPAGGIGIAVPSGMKVFRPRCCRSDGFVEAPL